MSRRRSRPQMPLTLNLVLGTETFELTDVNKIDRLPYLTQFFEDCLKRFYNFYGQPMQNQTNAPSRSATRYTVWIRYRLSFRCRCWTAGGQCVKKSTVFSVLTFLSNFSPLWEMEFNALVLRDTNENGEPDSIERSDSNVDTDAVEQPTDRAGEGSSETETKPTEPNETDTETPGTETEPAELIEDICPTRTRTRPRWNWNRKPRNRKRNRTKPKRNGRICYELA